MKILIVMPFLFVACAHIQDPIACEPLELSNTSLVDQIVSQYPNSYGFHTNDLGSNKFETTFYGSHRNHPESLKICSISQAKAACSERGFSEFELSATSFAFSDSADRNCNHTINGKVCGASDRDKFSSTTVIQCKGKKSN